MQLGLDSDGKQKCLSGQATPEAVLKKIQAFKHKTRWEGSIDEESGLLPHEMPGLQAAFSATNPGQTHSDCKAFRILRLTAGDNHRDIPHRRAWTVLKSTGFLHIWFTLAHNASSFKLYDYIIIFSYIILYSYYITIFSYIILLR